MLVKSFFISVLVVLGLVIQGCMPVTQPFVPVQVKADKALIYIYRPESFVARGSTWSVKANHKEISTYFINNGYISVYIESGDAELELYHKNIGFASKIYDTIKINNVKVGQTYYVKAFMKFGGDPHFEIMDNNVGEKEISEALYFVDQMKK